MISIDEGTTGFRYPVMTSYNFTSSSLLWSKYIHSGIGNTNKKCLWYDGNSTIYVIISYINSTYNTFLNIDVNTGPTTNHR